jgi:isopenicillin N synthase-like dioxygenase
MTADQAVIFAGESLGFVTGGQFRPALHKVRTVAKTSPSQLSGKTNYQGKCAGVQSVQNAWRMSMPFFLRMSPSSLLRSPISGLDCTQAEFVEKDLYSSRWWRAKKRGMPVDY